MSPGAEVMIHATELTKYYGNLKAIDSISFTLHRGEVLGFLGPNGAGKTTTMKILTCYFSPTSGRATVKGFSVFQNPTEVKKLIGYLPENAPLYGEMTPREYLRFIASVRAIPLKDILPKIRDISDVCGLQGVMGQEIRTLSKGYRQRVGLAQAMIHDPEIIILDEPTSGLDPKQIVEIRNLIKEIGKKKTIILSTHNLSEVQVTSNRVIIIHHGKIVADAPTDQIQQKMGRNRCQIVFAKNGQERKTIMEKLENIQGVDAVHASAETEEGTFTFDIDGKGDIDLRSALFNFSVEEKYKLLELKRERVNLESVFMDLTKD
jgi:ABC-2 type transport system ATP-binding protein